MSNIFLRDLDGTGSLHPCAKGDPGAIEFLPADRIQELESELRCPIGLDSAPMLCSAGTCPVCMEARLNGALDELSGVHAGTHCIVPFGFIEAACDPVCLSECSTNNQYIGNISVWAENVSRQAHEYRRAMLSAKEGKP